jgi:hypothetical protein
MAWLNDHTYPSYHTATTISKTTHNILLQEEDEEWKTDLLHDKVAVPLHNDTLDVVGLLRCVLPQKLAILVQGELAVGLHLELDLIVRAKQAQAASRRYRECLAY